ncbi:DEAD/DEAH box helicase family protein [Helicobacter cetorum]|uniref:DEAD/DEAH box helicase family protein n=1 Tax=Helicobacter cetorum TaxID=138563 RepID=UPI000CF17A35|nr:ATP-binding protein [Helicobacter cetorum]
MLNFIKEDSIIKAYNLNITKLKLEDREKFGLLKIENSKIYFQLNKEHYLELEIIGKFKEKEIKNAFCNNAFLVAQVLNLSKENQEKQVLELKCYFFKRPIKILSEPLNINFKDKIIEKITDKKITLEDFKKICILEMAGFTYFICVLPYEDEKEEKDENKEILEEDFRLLNAKGELSVKYTLMDTQHVYEALNLRLNKQELEPNLCLFFQGSLEFNDKTIKSMRASLLNQLQEDEKSYLKIWENYLIEGAQKNFKKTLKIGVLEIESIDKKNEDLKISFKQTLDKDKVEILKAGTLIKGYDLGVLKDLDIENKEKIIEFISQKDKAKIKSTNEKQTIEIKSVSGDYFIIDDNPSIKVGDTFYLDYMGSLNNLNKQYNALDKTKKGLSVNPNLGLILNIKEDSNDNKDATDRILKEILLNYKAKALELNDEVKKKIFKNPPTKNQEEAIKIALNTPDIAIIQGPPGTGKTTVINAIIERLFEEYPKDKNIKGQILLCAQGHDATNNVRERLKVGGLPTFKFGERSKSTKEERYKQNEILNTQLSELANMLIKNVKENLKSLGDYENMQKILDLEESLRVYYYSPISELELLKEIEKNASFLNSSMRETLNELKARHKKQEDANLSVIYALRTTQKGFEDDGLMRNYELLESKFKEKLTKEDKKLLESPKPNLEKIQELKIRLLEECIPKRDYEISKPKEEVVQLANDLLDSLSSQSPNDKRIRALLEYISVLERNPSDLVGLLKDYNFVFSSTIGQYDRALKTKESFYFDSVIIDEAAKANPLELLMVMALAKERIILVGDDRQLPHFMDDEIEEKLKNDNKDFQNYIEKALKESMFKKLKDRVKQLEKLDGKKRFITLDKQYRTHPLLGQLVSDTFYKPYNESFDSPLKEECFKHNLRVLDNRPCAWIDVKNDRENKHESSYYRESEIEKIKEYLKIFIEDEPNFTFGVITFYGEQKRRLEQALKDFSLVEVGTVDSFQGKEFDVVFLSSVRTKHTKEFGFLKDYQRLCVALSRQKKALIVVGDKDKFNTSNAKDEVLGLFNFLRLCEEKGKIL